MIQNLDFGKNIKNKYVCFELDPNLPLSEQILELREDLIYIAYDNNYILDVGWYPEGDLSGAFIVKIVRNYNWDNPVIEEECTDLNSLQLSLEKLIIQASNFPFYEIDSEVLTYYEEVSRNTMMCIPLEWKNLKSKHTYGWMFIEHGSHHQMKYSMDKARENKKQFGQWTDDQHTAEFIAQIAHEKGVGTHDIPLPNKFPSRVFLPNGIQAQADMARVIVNPDGSIQNAYPFSSRHSH